MEPFRENAIMTLRHPLFINRTTQFETNKREAYYRVIRGKLMLAVIVGPIRGKLRMITAQLKKRISAKEVQVWP